MGRVEKIRERRIAMMESLPYVMGILRAVLAAGGGYLVNQGLITASQIEPISGAVIIIGTAIWSIASKKWLAAPKEK